MATIAMTTTATMMTMLPERAPPTADATPARGIGLDLFLQLERL